MRIECRAIVAVVFGLSTFAPVARAQSNDSLRVGDRVRVRVVSAPGTLNVVTGNVASLSGDTLVVGLPGSRGTAVFPRLAIAQLGVSDGLESRSSQLVRAAPLLLTLPISVSLATLPTHSNGLRTFNIGLVGIQGFMVARMLSRPRLERWRSVTSWLDGR